MADGYDPPVPVNVALLAVNWLVIDEAAERCRGRFTAANVPPIEPAALPRLRRVDAMKPDALSCYVDGVAVNDASRAGDVLRQCRGGKQKGGSKG